MNTDRSRSRSRLMVAGLVALAAALLLGLTVLDLGGDKDEPRGPGEPAAKPWESPDYRNSGVPGDTDGDGAVSDQESATLAATVESVDAVRSTVAASKGGDTVLLTPGGGEWWTFVTSQAPALGLSTADAPDGVDWYAYTEGRTFKGLSDFNSYYSAIHVAFDDAATADQWVRDLSAVGHGSGAQFALRGRVVTIAPAWVNAHLEPYPEVDQETLSSIQAGVGLWQIDFNQQAKNRAREASDRVAYANFWDATGILGTWTATSPRPDLPWVGTLDGFDPARVDIAAAAAHVNTSVYACKQERQCRGDMGISEAIGDMFLFDETLTGSGEDLLLPEDVPAALSVGLVVTDSFRGMVNESYSLTGVSKTEYLVDEAGTLTLRLAFADPGTQES